MQRILIACAAVSLSASVVLAASPQVDAAIKTIQATAADPAKMKLFCALDDALGAGDQEGEGSDAAKGGAAAKGGTAAKGGAAAEKDDPALEKQIDSILAQLGADFGKAWSVGEGLDEKSADGAAFTAAVEALAAKCE